MRICLALRGSRHPHMLEPTPPPGVFVGGPAFHSLTAAMSPKLFREGKATPEDLAHQRERHQQRRQGRQGRRQAAEDQAEISAAVATSEDSVGLPDNELGDPAV